MTAPISVDGDAVKAYFAEAIAAYEHQSEVLARAPLVSASACGASFVAEGERIAAGLDMLQRRGLGLVQERLDVWQGVQSLVDDVVATDARFAEDLAGVERP